MHLPRFLVSCLIFAATAAGLAAAEPISFHADFESGSMGRVETVGPASFRVHVEGQANEDGRNRQPSWYYFRIDHAKGQALTLTLADFLGEYNFKPACPMSAELRPMYSADGQTWQHFKDAEWDDAKKEMTLRFHPESDAFFIAHIQPYPTSRLEALLKELAPRPSLRVEYIGRGSLGRPLQLLTVTDWSKPDAGKHCVWLQARQHAWEAGTSFAVEGALRFVTSDDPAAQALRETTVFKFFPMVDPDGVAGGKVRFNAQGYDVNRHWDKVDLRDPALLQRFPEIWYAKKALLAEHAKQPVELLLNLHNTETAEYIDTAVDDPQALQPVVRLFADLTKHTIFDPSRVPATGPMTIVGGNTNSMWPQAKVPVVLMEMRIGPSKKLGRFPTAEDRLKFGQELIQAMARACAP